MALQSAKAMPNSKKGTYLTPKGQLHTLAAKMSLTMVHGWRVRWKRYLANHCRIVKDLKE